MSAVITTVIGLVALFAGAIYALVKTQGDRMTEVAKVQTGRINDARDDFTKNIERLDTHLGERLTEQGTRLEQRIEALGDRLETQIGTFRASAGECSQSGNVSP